jgi:hypothetical protein
MPLATVLGAALFCASCSAPPAPPAITKRNPSRVERDLRNGAPVNALDREGVPPLVRAASEDRLDAALVLAAHGADLEGADWGGYRPLHRASEAGSLPVIEWLLALHADPNAPRGASGDTPLDLAARGECLSCVRSLLEGGARIDAQNAFGQQAIHFAAQQPERMLGASVRLLLLRGADAQARDGRGFTPAHFAALANNIAALEQLRDAGASLDAETPKGIRPIDSAAWARADIAYRWLRRTGHAGNRYQAPEPIEDAVLRNDAVELSWLLRFESDETLPPVQRRRLYRLALSSKKADAARVLGLLVGEAESARRE